MFFQHDALKRALAAGATAVTLLFATAGVAPAGADQAAADRHGAVPTLDQPAPRGSYHAEDTDRTARSGTARDSSATHSNAQQAAARAGTQNGGDYAQ